MSTANKGYNSGPIMVRRQTQMFASRQGTSTDTGGNQEEESISPEILSHPDFPIGEHMQKILEHGCVPKNTYQYGNYRAGRRNHNFFTNILSLLAWSFICKTEGNGKVNWPRKNQIVNDNVYCKQIRKYCDDIINVFPEELNIFADIIQRKKYEPGEPSQVYVFSNNLKRNHGIGIWTSVDNTRGIFQGHLIVVELLGYRFN